MEAERSALFSSVSHVQQRLAGMDKLVDNSCKQRAEYLPRFFFIIRTQRGQSQTSFTREKSPCLAEVSVTEQIYGNFQIPRNPGGTEHAQTVCFQALFFSAHAREPRKEAWCALVFS